MIDRHWTTLVRPQSVETRANGRNVTLAIEPLERGFGFTLGNALRRVMLSSIAGWAVVGARIDGAEPSQERIAGVDESLEEVLLNLKAIALRADAGIEPFTATITARRRGPVVAGDLVLPQGVEVADPGHVLCTLEAGATFRAELAFARGHGYVPAAAHAPDVTPQGFMALDSLFSPIRQVSYQVEPTRLGHVLDYDRLLLHVETNETVDCEEALTFAARVLHDQLSVFINFEEAPPQPVEEEPDLLGFNPELLRRMDDLELSVRASNCMRHENIVYLGDLVTRSEAALMRVPNFGRKSLNEIKAMLATLGLSLGMEVATWPPDDVEALARRHADNE